ncbi:hypothetical protein QBC43DRAFT_312517 [Cladorrhinum sp. PSN259]|nr:hypothetical protein QBC43DRAFT_312517 [Cladorrhinum sp. PSN259]
MNPFSAAMPSSSSSSLSSLTSPPDSSTSFHQFPLFPGEIQNLIWDQAAALSPGGIHFLTPTAPPRYYNSGSAVSSSWNSNDITLVPSHNSAALNTINLSLTCRASRAAVLRHEKSITDKTYLRTISSGANNHPSMNLTLNLRRDMICFSTGSWDDNNSREAVDSVEGYHIVFSSARKLGLRYKKGWELPGFGPFPHERRCLGGWREGFFGDERLFGFCSFCVARVVERFSRLEEVWMIVDEGTDDAGDNDENENEANWKGGRVSGVEGWDGFSISSNRERRRFEGYKMSYVTVGKDEDISGTVREASEVLERIKCSLMDPRFSQPPWLETLWMGILISRRS